MDDKIELLRRVPLFAELDEAGLTEIARIADEVETAANTVITHEGRYEGWFFVVVSGSVKIDQGGQAVNLMGPGDFLGEVALLDAGPRTATATTQEPTTLLRITNDAFSKLVDSSPTFRDAVLAAAGARLRAMERNSAG